MSIFLTLGRVFFGTGIAGIGILHFFYPGVRPLLIPGLTSLPTGVNFIPYLVAALLICTGLLIAVGIKFNNLAFLMGILFLGFFLFGHLPTFLSAGSFNNYWVNLNKILALAGGFLVVSTANAPKNNRRITKLIHRVGPVGRYLYAIMLYNFAVGHFNNLEGIGNMVPKYIAYPQFWVFIGGITLMGSAISIFSRYHVRTVMLLLGLNLFLWLVLLHLYYTVRFPAWSEGENFVGSLTCLCFCGTALVISQADVKKKAVQED